MRHPFALASLPLVLALGCAGDRVAIGDGAGENALVDRTGQACATPLEEASCGDGGVQYCSPIEDELEWGPCLTEAECSPGEAASCDGWGTQTCTLYGGVPYWNTDECESGGGDTPLVLKFSPAPAQVEAASASTFDISGRGGCLSTDWPSPTTPWLAIDLDRDGVIEDGRELFGSGTILPDGTRAQQGFEALAILDTNADGVITVEDERFDELVAWADEDRDRVGTLRELTPLTTMGLSAIQLGYSSRASCDARGNCEIERAAFSWTGGRGEVVDLHLACQ